MNNPKWTLESALERLENDIREAESRYARRVQDIGQRANRPVVARLTSSTGQMNRAERSEEAHNMALKRYFKALELRETGLTYKQVGATLGVSSTRANQMCNNAYRMRKRQMATPTD